MLSDVPARFVDTIERIEYLASGDDEFRRELIDAFVLDIGTRINCVDAAIGNSDGEYVAKEAHLIRGACGNLSAQAMQVLAEELEEMGKGGQLEAGKSVVMKLRATFEEFSSFFQQYIRGS